VLNGKATKKSGAAYSEATIDRIWNGLARCCRKPELQVLIRARRGCHELAALCHENAISLTGRIRAGCIFTEARNTPFQGLASDGAKIALFELVRAGYRVVAFVHDEFVIELPAGGDHADEAQRVEAMVCSAMSSVVNGTVPVKAEYVLSTCWSKDAKQIFDEQGRLLPWSPKTESSPL
jgi:hypothetical protein